MTEWLARFGSETAVLFAQSTPYLFVGFYLAGLLKVLVPESLIYRQLGGDRLKSVFLAALYGTPIPLCSCSVIPTAVALKRAGASKGATASFLISTPETGVDSISMTWALLDPILTVVRPLAAFVTAVATGGLVNVFVRNKWDGPEPAAPADDEASCCGHDHDHGAAGATEAEPERQPSKPKAAWRYAFGPLLDDLTPWFVLGFLISGLIATVTPANLFTEIVPRGWPAILLMMVIGTPMYICATASTPVAAALIAKGLEPGAALVFLLVGPATNITTLLIVAQLLGRRVLMLYLIGIVGLALAFGLGINALYGALGTDLSATVAETLGHGVAPWETVVALVFLFFLLASVRRLGLVTLWGRKVGGWLGCDPSPRAIRVALGLVVLGLWGSTGLTSVRPGETAFRMRFGLVVDTRSEPGLVLHWPAPIETVAIVRENEVRATELGYRSVGENEVDRLELDGEAEIACGDETLLSITYVVHWAAKDAWALQFRLVDPDALVRVSAEAALRSILAGRSSSDVLVGDRPALERAAAERLQDDLDEIEAGVRVVAVYLRDVHAPEDVHASYRDVASALEDQERERHEARGFEAEALAQARAGAWTREQRARAEARGVVDLAQGGVAGFLGLADEYARHPEIMGLGLFLEAAERAYAGARIVLPFGSVDVSLYQVTKRGEDRATSTPDEPQWLEDLEGPR